MVRALMRSWPGRVGVLFVGIVVAIVVLSYIWVPHDPLRVVPQDKFLPISRDHLFGTGADGKDIFSAVIVGARVSLFVALTSAAIAGVIGLLLGVTSAVVHRVAGEAIANLIDVLIAIPQLVLALVLLGLFGGGLWTVSIAIGFGAGFVLALVVRGECRKVLAQDYIVAANASGTSTVRTVARHLLPNIAPIVIVQLALFAGIAIVAEASLAYLGLTSASRPSWGRTLRDLQRTVTVEPWPILFPGIALVIAAIGFNLLGDGLRDALDPRLRQSKHAPGETIPAAQLVPAPASAGE
jgi:peptide/nickel transport system permease protein